MSADPPSGSLRPDGGIRTFGPVSTPNSKSRIRFGMCTVSGQASREGQQEVRKEQECRWEVKEVVGKGYVCRGFTCTHLVPGPRLLVASEG